MTPKKHERRKLTFHTHTLRALDLDRVAGGLKLPHTEVLCPSAGGACPSAHANCPSLGAGDCRTWTR